MARPSNTAERRVQIVAALGRVMARGGYEGATIAAIAREAKLAPGLVHYHFESKLEVLVALVDRLTDDVRTRYRLLSRDTDARGGLHAFIDAHLALGPGASVSAVGAWSVIGAEAIRLPEVRALYRRALASALRELGRLVRAVRREAGQSLRGTQACAAAILAAIEGSLRIGAVAPGVLPRGSAASTVRQMANGLVDMASKHSNRSVPIRSEAA